MMQPPLEWISLADFLDWEQLQENKHELLDGEIVGFSGGSFDRNDIALNVCRLLDDRVAPPCKAHNSDTIIETRREQGRERPASRRRRFMFERGHGESEIHAASTYHR